MQPKTLLALESARPRGELGDRDAAGLVDEQRQARHLLAGLDQALELRLVDHTAADLLRGNAGLLGHDAGGELLGRHFEREETDHCAVMAGSSGCEVGLAPSERARARAMLKAMLVASAVLPIDGRPARMIRSEACRPPILASSAFRTGGNAGEAAFALVGVVRHLDGSGQRTGERSRTPGRTCRSRPARRAASPPPRSAPWAGSRRASRRPRSPCPRRSAISWRRVARS